MGHGPVIMHTLDFAGQHELLRVLGKQQNPGIGDLPVTKQVQFLKHGFNGGICRNPPVPCSGSLADEPFDFRRVDIINRRPVAGRSVKGQLPVCLFCGENPVQTCIYLGQQFVPAGIAAANKLR